MSKSIRQRLLASVIYTSGSTFTTADAMRHLSIDQKQLNGTLRFMLDKHELDIIKKTNQGATYQKPKSGIMRIPWVPAQRDDYYREMAGFRR